MYDYFPGEGLALGRENRRVAVKAAGDLVESKIRETRGRRSGRDIDAARCVSFVVPYRCEFQPLVDSQRERVFRQGKHVG